QRLLQTVDHLVLVVNVPYPGASPETVEREVVNRLEKALQSISGVDRTQATAREGSATVVLTFDFSKNMIEAADDARNAIAGIRFKLPAEIREPIISRADPGARPIVQLALSSSSLTHAQISRMAED
ncbi:MAG: efflux RND transporter permease subunit, partial [Inhella sp.]